MASSTVWWRADARGVAAGDVGLGRGRRQLRRAHRHGLLALVGVALGDTGEDAAALARKIATLRILRDEQSVADVPGAAVLVVSQFTLYGDTRKGRRPSWSAAAPGPVAEPLVDAVAAELRRLGVTVATGVFGADMRVSLVNDGPVTVLIETGRAVEGLSRS